MTGPEMIVRATSIINGKMQHDNKSLSVKVLLAGKQIY